MRPCDARCRRNLQNEPVADVLQNPLTSQVAEIVGIEE
jgi:hypothetical protein